MDKFTRDSLRMSWKLEADARDESLVVFHKGFQEIPREYKAKVAQLMVGRAAHRGSIEVVKYLLNYNLKSARIAKYSLLRMAGLSGNYQLIDLILNFIKAADLDSHFWFLVKRGGFNSVLKPWSQDVVFYVENYFENQKFYKFLETGKIGETYG